MSFFGANTDTDNKKIKITAYKLNKKTDSTSTKIGSYTLKINPETVRFSSKVRQRKDMYIEGGAGGSSNYIGVEPDDVSLKFTIDGTGVLEDEMNVKDVKKEINTLKKLIIEYNKDLHEPPYLEITWGEIFQSSDKKTYRWKCTSFDVDYILFNKDGKPLRAEIECRFEQFSAAKNRSHSADISHTVEVREYDTLPNLCYKVYNDPSHYLQVARANGLTNIHRLTPGQKLLFPPLAK